MRFSEMKYERPELEEIKGAADRIKKAFDDAGSFEAADSAFAEWDRLISHTDTMFSLAYIRNSVDTTDEYYEKEAENLIEIKKCLLKELSKDWNPKQNNLYKLVKILTKTK